MKCEFRKHNVTCKLQPNEALEETHVKVEEGVHLVLNNGYGLEQLLCVHGPHYAVDSVWTCRVTVT